MNIKTKPEKKAMFLIVFAIFIWWLFQNYEFVVKALGLFLEIISPFLIGLGIAFVFNKPMSFIEEKLFGKSGPFKGLKDQFKRPISFLITLTIFVAIIALVLILVVPNLIKAADQIAQKIPKYLEDVQAYIQTTSFEYSKINEQIQQIDFDNFNSLFSFVKGGFSNWVGSTFTVFSSVIGGIISAGIGFMFAIYFLFQKEELILSIKKLLYAALPPKVANRIIYIGKLTKNSFSEFLIGQTIDALALGGLFFVSMMIFRFPYALMVSVIISISAFVPIVGSFVGLVIGAFLIFVESAKMAGLFVILFLVLQQIEGNLIYPKVVGKASGLSSVWILAAVTLGGSIMGILGIIIFVPLFSVMQKLLKEYIDSRLEEKKIDESKI